MEKAFITGATGFIGKSLLKSLIENTEINSFILLVRNKEKAKLNLSKLLILADYHEKNISMLEGDLTKQNLGISQADIDKLMDVQEVYHLASNISLSNNEKYRDIVFDTNVEGTRNIIQLFINSNKVNNVYYFSSIFASGKSKEIIKEDWLQRPTKFRNHYEESKFLTEQMIKNYINNYNIPVTILRPSIVTASSKTDFSKVKNQTFYYFSRVLKKAIKLNNNSSIEIIGKPRSQSNIIQIDDLIMIVLEIRKLNEKKQIYNLINPSNISTSSFLESIRELLNFKYNIILREDLNYNDLKEVEKFIYDRTESYFEYNLEENLLLDYNNIRNIAHKLNIKEIDNIWIKDHLREFFSFLENERQ